MERDALLSDEANFDGFAPEDRMGFAAPVTPAHSLRLLNDYMRTDLLLNVHRHVREMMNQKKRGSPIHHLAKSLDKVIRSYGAADLFEYVGRNEFHADPNHDFRPEQDYHHDIGLMKHHLQCLKKTIAELNRYR